MSNPKNLGVVLFQLGGPDSRAAVEPFLYNLFSDPDIIDLPLGWLARKPLARFLARRRKKHVVHAYEEIGGGSPIGLLTERQARALERALRPHVEPRVVVAMRYWHPFTAEAVRQLEAASLDAGVLLPLYPQYSMATTGSSLHEWNRCYRGQGIPVRIIEQFYDHPLYLDAVVANINLSLRHFASRAPSAETTQQARITNHESLAASQQPLLASHVHLLFSAHGLPMSFLERGDPYQRQVEETVRLVMERGADLASRSGLRDAWPNSHSLCYQSKVGRQRWLEPSLDSTLVRLASQGARQVLVVPISFVTEHVETLYEINVEAREKARALGIEQFEMMPALNDSPRFIAALADLVLRAARFDAEKSAAAR